MKYWISDCALKKARRHKRKGLFLAQKNKNKNKNIKHSDSGELFNMKNVPLKDEDTQFADSGATEHMCFRKEWIKNIRKYIHRKYIGDTLYVKGKEDINIEVINI